MFAVIKTGGKQYIITPETKLKIEKITPNDKGEVIFDKVLLVVDDNGKITLGNPFIKDVEVVGKVEEQGRSKKIIVFKYKAKKRYKKKAGHRQYFTEVSIKSIKKPTSTKKSE